MLTGRTDLFAKELRATLPLIDVPKSTIRAELTLSKRTPHSFAPVLNPAWALDASEGEMQKRYVGIDAAQNGTSSEARGCLLLSGASLVVGEISAATQEISPWLSSRSSQAN